MRSQKRVEDSQLFSSMDSNWVIFELSKTSFSIHKHISRVISKPPCFLDFCQKLIIFKNNLENLCFFAKNP